ncbi:hypothetical protein [Roseovarius indicus]|uniref:Uncharacterized protein n=1 Tax=Roseovarius indicus TaxID=540747 RepID=A0A0T5PC78_9RHOB|nr:hypothetical protein [Roseovarius indicus]KRS18857.1 hypothetical protein XM52_04000 [Roseovarius indicus]QEW26227.1 hypothetical protein RIdsm_02024 [Roseovarius indicus]SFD95045.1 hypothetical protein SAMN04488031_103437 [Roseovarius indicus]
MSWTSGLSTSDLLELKPKGHYRICETEDGFLVTINIPGEPPDRFICASRGAANQLAIRLSDMGLTGLWEA